MNNNGADHTGKKVQIRRLTSIFAAHIIDCSVNVQLNSSTSTVFFSQLHSFKM